MKIPAGRKSITLAALAALAALALAGCENPVTVSGVDIAHGYSTADLRRYGTGGNELRVVVSGDPFGDGAEDTAFAVVDAMQAQNIGTPVAFAVNPRQEGRPPSRVVLYINARRLVGSETLCAPQAPVTTAPSANGQVRISGAWCQTNFVLSRADARIDSAKDLDSKEFRALVAQLTIALFPPRNPHDKTRFLLCPPFCR